MARFEKEISRLPMIVSISPDDGTSTGPRLKFQDNSSDHINPEALVPISIDPKEPSILLPNYQTNLPSEDIAKLKQWITQNHDVLLKYWNGEVLEGILMRDAKLNV